MKNYLPAFVVLLMCVSMGFIPYERSTSQASDYWVLFCDEDYDCGYLNSKGDTMIQAGVYPICYTDTFRSYAIVSKPGVGFVGINKQEKVLYTVFPYDNGPDPVSEGRFRILKNGLIGFADERTGKVMIYPQYKCAMPYENGVSEVSFDCNVKPPKGDEHGTWTGGNWFYIDHAGKKAAPPEH